MPINRRVKRRLILLSVLVVLIASLLGGATIFAQWNKSRKIELNYKEGMAAYEAGDYVTALPKLSFAVSNRKDDIELTLAFADTRRRNIDETGQHIKGAVNIYRHILTLEPNNEEAIRSLLDIYVATGSTAEAINLSRKLPDNDLDAIQARITALSRAGRTEQAIEEVSILRDAHPNESTWPLIEFQLRNSIDESPESMLTLLEEYTAEYPNNQTVTFVKVPLLRLANQREEAIVAARDLANLPNIDLNILLELHQHLVALGLREEAAQVLQQAKDSADVDPEIASALIERSWRYGNLDEARKHAQAGIENFPDDLQFLRYDVLLVTIDPNSNDLEQSLTNLLEKSQSVDTARAKRDALLVDALRAYSESSSSSLQPTLTAMRAAVNVNQELLLLQYLEAVLLQRAGQTDDAVESFENIYKRTNARLAGLRLVNGLLRKQQSLEALTYVNDLFGRYPTIDIFILRANTWLALARSGRDPISFDQTVKLGSTMTQLIRSAYGQIMSNAPKQATLILPLLAEAAALEDDDVNFKYACDQAIASDHTKPAELLAIARLIDEREEGSNEEFLLLAEERGAKPFDLELIRVRSSSDPENDGTNIAHLLELANQLEEGSDARTSAMRRILSLTASSSLESESGADIVARLFGELREDPSSARIILAYPNIWSTNPELAEDALGQLGTLVGEDTVPYVIANARRIAVTEADNPALRAQAIVSLDDVLRRSPSSVQAMLLMSDLLQTGNEPDLPRAVGYLQSALDSQPGQVQLYPRLIQLLQEIGERDLALEYLQRYQEVASDDSNAARSRVALFMRQGEIDAAIDQIKIILEETNDPLDRIALAQLLVRQGREDEAIREYDVILEDDSENQLATHGKALLFAHLGDAEGALKIVDSCESIEPSDRMRARIQILLASGKIEEAVHELKVLTELAPNDAATWVLVAAVRESAGDSDGTRVALERSLKINPENGQALTQLIPILVSDPSRWNDARNLLPQLEKSSPALAKSFALSMDAADPETGTMRPSSEYLARSRVLVEEYPASLDARRVCWLLHSAARDNVGALAIARESMNALPASASPAQWGFRSAIRAGQWDDALQMAYANRDRQPVNARMQSEMQIAALCSYLGRHSEAAISLDRFVPVLTNDDAIYELSTRGTSKADQRLRPDQRLPARLRAQVLRTMLAAGNVDRAYRVLEELIDVNPGLQEVWLSATTTADPTVASIAIEKISPRLRSTQAGKFRLAQAWVALAAATKEPQLIAQAHEAVSNAAVSNEDDRRALAILEASLETASGNIPETMDILRENIKLFTPEEIAQLKQIESLPPEEQQEVFRLLITYVMTLNNLAYQHTLFDAGNLEEASTLIDEALALVPQPMEPELLDTKASILAKQGLYQEARSTITRASQMAPSRADFKLRKVRILMLENMDVEATMLAEEVLEELLDAPQPDLEQVDEAKMLIRELNEGDNTRPQVEGIG